MILLFLYIIYFFSIFFFYFLYHLRNFSMFNDTLSIIKMVLLEYIKFYVTLIIYDKHVVYLKWFSQTVMIKISVECCKSKQHKIIEIFSIKYFLP